MVKFKDVTFDGKDRKIIQIGKEETIECKANNCYVPEEKRGYDDEGWAIITVTDKTFSKDVKTVQNYPGSNVSVLVTLDDVIISPKKEYGTGGYYWEIEPRPDEFQCEMFDMNDMKAPSGMDLGAGKTLLCRHHRRRSLPLMSHDEKYSRKEDISHATLDFTIAGEHWLECAKEKGEKLMSCSVFKMGWVTGDDKKTVKKPVEVFPVNSQVRYIKQVHDGHLIHDIDGKRTWIRSPSGREINCQVKWMFGDMGDPSGSTFSEVKCSPPRERSIFFGGSGFGKYD